MYSKHIFSVTRLLGYSIYIEDESYLSKVCSGLVLTIPCILIDICSIIPDIKKDILANIKKNNIYTDVYDDYFIIERSSDCSSVSSTNS